MKKVLLKTAIKGLILDGDGVLIDSPGSSMERLCQTAEICGAKIPDPATLKKCWAQSWEDLIPNFAAALGWSPDEAQAVQKKFPELLSRPFNPIPGLRETLTILRKKGMLLALVSGGGIQGLINRAVEAKIDLGLFSHIQAVDTYQFSKPDPRAFQPALQVFSERGIKAEEVVCVGDTIAFDVKAAQTHEPPLNFIGIISAASSKQEFLEAGVPEKLILRTLAAVPNVLPYFN